MKYRYTRSNARKSLLLGLTILSAGCSRDEQPSALVGQWHLEMMADSLIPASAGRSGFTEGVLVFDDRIREHSGVESPLQQPYAVGRYYANLSNVSARVDTRRPFQVVDMEADDLDLLQEIIGKVEADTLIMVAAPRIIGTQITYEGTFRGATAVGTWSFPAHGSDAFSAGRFRMWRVENQPIRDSAITRSQRGTRNNR